MQESNRFFIRKHKDTKKEFNHRHYFNGKNYILQEKQPFELYLSTNYI